MAWKCFFLSSISPSFGNLHPFASYFGGRVDRGFTSVWVENPTIYLLFTSEVIDSWNEVPSAMIFGESGSEDCLAC